MGTRGTVDETGQKSCNWPGNAMKSFIIHDNEFFFTRLTEYLETSLFSFSFQNLYALYFGIKQSLVML